MPKHEPSNHDFMHLGRTTAGLDLLARSGCTSINLSFDDDEGVSPDGVLWLCEANWNGNRAFSRHYPYPDDAVYDLLRNVICGGGCPHCGKTTLVGMEVPGFCCFTLQAGDLTSEGSYKYVQTCKQPRSTSDAEVHIEPRHG